MELKPTIVAAIDAFRSRNPAPASFEAFSEDCARLAASDPLNAGFYAMLGLHARSFTERHEGRPLTANVAEEAKGRLIGHAERVAPALALNPEAKLALLNDLAHALVSADNRLQIHGGRMNPIRRIVIFTAAALAAGLAGGAAAQAKYPMKVAHLESPTQPRHQALLKVAELVKSRTKGEVDMQLFPAAQLGNARQQVEGVQFGTIEASMMPAAFIAGFNPAVSILDIPYLFPSDRAKSQQLRSSPFGKAVLDSFATRQLVALTLWPNGRKSLTSNKSLDKLDSLGGQKFRVMDSKILMEQFAAVGASAVAIQFGEVYTSLQTGVIDGQENPLDSIATMKFHEVQKNLVVTEHGSMEDVFLVNPAWWGKLPAGHRDVIQKALDEVRPQFEKMKDEAQVKALDQIKASGKISVRVADEGEKKRMRDAMFPKARAAYLERAGAEGQKLLDLYQQEAKRLGL
jgi:C4-dicarboxylate-binding protein DctP